MRVAPALDVAGATSVRRCGASTVVGAAFRLARPIVRKGTFNNYGHVVLSFWHSGRDDVIVHSHSGSFRFFAMNRQYDWGLVNRRSEIPPVADSFVALVQHRTGGTGLTPLSRVRTRPAYAHQA